MPEKKSFILYIDRKKELDLLTAEQCGFLFKAIFDYVDSGKIVDFDDIAIKLMFSVFKSQIDENSAKWEEVRKRRSEAGKKGGAPKGNKNASKQTNQAKTSNGCLKQAKQAKQAVTVTVTDTVTDILSLSKDNDNIEQACTAPKGAAQPACDDEYDYIEIDETSGEWA